MPSEPTLTQCQEALLQLLSWRLRLTPPSSSSPAWPPFGMSQLWSGCPSCPMWSAWSVLVSGPCRLRLGIYTALHVLAGGVEHGQHVSRLCTCLFASGVESCIAWAVGTQHGVLHAHHPMRALLACRNVSFTHQAWPVWP